MKWELDKYFYAFNPNILHFYPFLYNWAKYIFDLEKWHSVYFLRNQEI